MNEADIEASQRALDAGAVALIQVAPEDEAAGIVRRFIWRGEEIEVLGDVSHAEAGLVVSRVEVQARTSAGLTHRLLHTVPLGMVLAAVRSSLSFETFEKARESVLPTPLPPGRVQITDDLLRTVAMAYLEETGPGKDRAVLQRMEDRFGRPKGTVRTWINRAREEGWLGPAVQGRMGAAPGHKLVLWLGQQMASDEMLTKDFTARAIAMKAKDPAAAVAIAIRAFRTFALSDFPRRTGIPPVDVQLAAGDLYRRTADEELAARIGAGEDEDEAFDQIAAEIQARLAA